MGTPTTMHPRVADDDPLTSLGADTRRTAWVIAIFVMSGAAGLIYEIVWSRQLVLVFGNTTQAVSTILTGFFAGMAIGSFVGGRVADRVRSPMRLYGVLELVLVALVIATPFTFQVINVAYRRIYPELEGAPVALSLIRFGLAILALAPATILMGATLPVLTRYLGHGGHLSGAFSRLYAANTYGAILGTLAAGLILIELLGLTRTLLIGAAASGCAGIIALWLSSSEVPPSAAVAHEARTDAVSAPSWLPLMLAFVSGVTSLGYQVLWTRLLSSGTGNLTYVFTMILAVFLIGIAVGAQTFAALRQRLGGSLNVIAGAQAIIAMLAIAGLVFVIAHPDPTHSQMGNTMALLRPLLIVVLPTTLVLGFMLPAASTLLTHDDTTVGTHAGRLLAMNTLGAVVGAFVIPFALIPTIGSATAVALVAALNVALAVVVIGLAPARGRAAPVLASLAGVSVFLAFAVPGAIRDPGEARIVDSGGRVTQSEEDQIAAVQAGVLHGPGLWVSGTSMTHLTVDAKLMAVLPLVLRPKSRTALIVAFGMGSAYRAALIADLGTTGAELVPSVPEMFSNFHRDAAEVLADPRGRVVIADGRNHLELTHEVYDIIVTDPPPPIESSGASIISSLEYYKAGHARLSPGGVMMQWTPWGSTVDELKAHLRTFHHVYPHVIVAFGSGSGFFMFGSDRPLSFTDSAVDEILARPGVLRDLASSDDSPHTTLDGWKRWIRSSQWIANERVAAFTGPGPLITDDRPFSEYFLLRRFGRDGAAIGEPELRALTE